MDLAIFHIILIVSQCPKSSNELMPLRIETGIDMRTTEMMLSEVQSHSHYHH